MNDNKFKQLILDVYKEWKNSKRRQYVWGSLESGWCTNFSGYIYGKDLEGSFKDIKNIEETIDTVKPELLILKSRITNQQVGLYKQGIDDYIIDEDILIIEHGDKKLIFGM